ncbi:MAG: ribosomal protein [Bacteroidetes bacterium]|nr:ribosomal protein [Bacteroidota bacterium]
MVRQYETVFIMTPVLSEQQIKETVQKYQSLLTESGAEIVYENNWGMRKLAYPIQKKSTGFYYLIEFKAEGELIAKLETTYKRDEKLLRFLTVSLDKHAIAYNEKKRSGGMRKQQEAAMAKQEIVKPKSQEEAEN